MNEDTINELMQRCMRLAVQAPQRIRKPKVGAMILLPTEEIIGEGYRTYIDNTHLVIHAERMAFNNVSGRYSTQGTTLITTLEPCMRKEFGRQPLFSSCCDMIIENGIKRVIMGAIDTSPSMNKKNSRDYLSKRGIEVIYYKNFQELIQQDLLQYN